MDNINNLIKNKDWLTLSKSYTPNYLSEILPLNDALLVSRLILENEDWNDNLQTYAIKMIKSLRSTHPVEWNRDWRHEAYLGYAYDLRGWDYEERFDAYKKAADRSNPPDPEVLMRLAMGWSSPGVYKIKMDESEAIKLLENSMKEHPYIEGVSCLVDLYEKTLNREKQHYWSEVLKECEAKKMHAPYAFLDFFDELRGAGSCITA